MLVSIADIEVLSSAASRMEVLYEAANDAAAAELASLEEQYDKLDAEFNRAMEHLEQCQQAAIEARNNMAEAEANVQAAKERVSQAECDLVEAESANSCY